VQNTPPRLRRVDSFFGLHFDFHAGEKDWDIGKHTTPETIEEVIAATHPDYIQCDCKGHPGWSSYPTKAGIAAPGIVADALQVWREATAKHGVALYMHYSGVWDAAALKLHPEWARVDEKGGPDPKNTSVFGPYARELLIPQLRELHDSYGVDGVWLDGECWATCQDYREDVLETFRELSGITEIPRKPEDPYFFEFTEFCREGFRKYVSNYVDILHRECPGFQIASNWAYTTFMPEAPAIPLDFLSGDYTMQNSVNSARIEGRYLANQGRPWDLMAWGFAASWDHLDWTEKPAIMLKREAALVLALGGGFQIYLQQNRDGSVRLEPVQRLTGVAEFCRARQAFSHQSERVSQIGLLLSTDGFYRKNHRLFATWSGETDEVKGVLNYLLEGQQCVDVIGEHHLDDNALRDFPLIVVPEWKYLDPQFVERLTRYAEDGGSLLLISPATAALFGRATEGLTTGQPSDERSWLEHNGRLAGIKDAAREVAAPADYEPFGRLLPKNDDRAEGIPAAHIRPFGNGKIACVHFGMGKRHLTARTTLVRAFLSALVAKLFPNPLVSVSGSHLVDVVLRRKTGRLFIHLINTGGPHADMSTYTYDEIPAVGPLEISLRGRPAGEVMLLPENIPLDCIYANGVTRIHLPRLEIHSAIAMDFPLAG